MSALFYSHFGALRSRGTSIVWIAASVCAVSSAANAADAQPRESRALEEVIVTAQRRAERPEDVPIAISVLGGDTLDRAIGSGAQDALVRVPGIVQSSDPLTGGAQLAVRGVATSAPFLGGSGPVAYYLDSVPFGLVKTSLVPDANAYDLQRIEVLRGPQGTLYGASALNGVVRVLTHEADLDQVDFKTRTAVSSTKDGSESYRADAAVNMPLVPGRFAARITGGYQHQGGWIENLVGEDRNESDTTNVRLKLRAQPSDAFSIGLSAWSSRTDGDAPAMSDDDDFYNGALDQPTAVDFDVYGLQLGYEFAGGASISSATSYIDFSNGQTVDVTPLGAPVPYFTGLDSRIFTQEINVNSSDEGAWRWSAGALYRDGEDHLFQNGVIIVAPFDFTDKSESYAVYGELTRVFADGRWELTGGLRYFEDDVQQIENTPHTGNPAQPLWNRSESFDALTPRVVLAYHPSERATLYASFSEGFRSGYNQSAIAAAVAPDLPPVEEDVLRNYEVGFKSDLAGGLVTLDAAVYYIDWQDVQQVLSVEITSDTFATAGVNGQSASGAGIDFAMAVRPAEGLELAANVSWNDLTLDEAVFSAGLLLFDKGERLNYSSEYTLGASIDYAFAFGGSGLEGRFSAAGNWTSPQSVSQIIGPSAVTTEGDKLVNVRSSLSVGSEHWTAMLFVDNATNDRGAPVRNAFTDTWSTRIRPRTVGLQFEYRY